MTSGSSRRRFAIHDAPTVPDAAISAMSAGEQQDARPIMRAAPRRREQPVADLAHRAVTAGRARDVVGRREHVGVRVGDGDRGSRRQHQPQVRRVVPTQATRRSVDGIALAASSASARACRSTPCATSAMPSSRMRAVTAADARPEIMATAMPARDELT